MDAAHRRGHGPARHRVTWPTREPVSLSGGEQQRVAIASIVVDGPGRPRPRRADRPARPGGADAVADLLGDLAEAGTTDRRASSTIPARSLDRCERVVTLDGGRDRRRRPTARWPQAATLAVDRRRAASRPAWRAGAPVAIERRRLSLSERHRGAARRHARRSSRGGRRHRRRTTARARRPSPSTSTACFARPPAASCSTAIRPTAARSPTSRRRSGSPSRTRAISCSSGRSSARSRFGPRQLGRSPARQRPSSRPPSTLIGLTDERDTNPYDLDRRGRKLVDAGRRPGDGSRRPRPRRTDDRSGPRRRRAGRADRRGDAGGRSHRHRDHPRHGVRARVVRPDRRHGVRVGCASDPRRPGA